MSALTAIIGTAGHIDHGKTSLVRRLTGIDTDRLPEEKARGISIELGFAHLILGDLTLGIVDVPGHEKFIRQMVSGAQSIDFGLLVVAADDGVMPQTREHIEVMQLLGIERGLVAITKSDLPDKQKEIESEIQLLVKGTFLEGSPILAVSAHTGEGIAELKQTIERIIRRERFSDPKLPFYLPIDRAFAMEGFGPVVTGSVGSGELSVGDQVEIVPSRLIARVRGIERHGKPVQQSRPRERAAINLTGVRIADLARGQSLCQPGFLVESQRLLVRIELLPPADRLRDRMTLQLHLGTACTTCRLALMSPKGKEQEESKTSRSIFGVLTTNEPVAGFFGQRFILRIPSPSCTIAGGVLLDPNFTRFSTAAGFEQATRWSSPDPITRLSVLVLQKDGELVSPMEACRQVGIPLDQFQVHWERLRALGEIIPLKTGVVHREKLQSIVALVERKLRSEFERASSKRCISEPEILLLCRKFATPEILVLALEKLVQDKVLICSQSPGKERTYSPKDRAIILSRNQQVLQKKCLEAILAGETQPPFVADLSKQFQANANSIRELLDLLCEAGSLVLINEEFYCGAEGIDRARQRCRDILEKTPQGVSLSMLREAWETTRKFAIPLAEYFDRMNWTKRKDDLRFPGP